MDKLEKKIEKSSTSSGAMNVVILSLAATLATDVNCYGFEEDNFSSSENYKNNLRVSHSNVFERLENHTEEFYGQFKEGIFDSNTQLDLKFTELSQEFAESQVGLDPEVQKALNLFSREYGSEKPSKDRF